MSVVDRFKTGHLWVGNVSSLPEGDYMKYFEQTFNPDEDTVDYSPFFRDIGCLEAYDEDFIIIFEPLPEPVSIDELLPEIPLAGKKECEKVKKLCNELPVTEGFDTFVFYSDPELKVPKGKLYNGLYYLGNFKAECV